MPRDRSGSGRRGRSRRKRILLALAAVGGVLVLLLALAPKLAGQFAPGIVKGALSPQIRGTVDGGRVSLAWFGSQRVEGLSIADEQGRSVARVSVVVPRGLARLAAGLVGLASADVGTIEVSGDVTLRIAPDGRTTMDDLLVRGAEPPPVPTPVPPPAPREASLPRSLAAGFRASGVTVTIIDERAETPESARVMRVPIDATASAAVGKPLRLALNLRATSGATPESATSHAGSLVLDASVERWSSAAGALTPAAATLDMALQIDALDTRVVDALAGTRDAVAAMVGDRLSASLRAAFDAAARTGSAEVTADSAGLGIDADLALADGVLAIARPLTVRVATAGLPAAAPAIASALAPDGPATIDAWPEVTLTVDALRVPIPAKGGALDLRGAAATATIATGQTRGRVRVPTAEGALGPPRPLVVEPLTLRLAIADLADQVRLTGSSRATLGGTPAGTLEVDLTARGLLDDAGAPRAAMPAHVRGSVALRSVVTAIAQPIVAGLAAGTPVRLSTEVGPTVDIVLMATASAEGDGAAPSSTITLAVDSENIEARAGVRIDGQAVRGAGERGDDLRVTVRSVGPLVNRMLAGPDFGVATGGPITVRVRDLRADLDRLAAGPDLRAAGALVTLEAPGMAARARLAPGQPVRRIELSAASLSLDARDLAAGAKVSMRLGAQADGESAGAITADFTANSLLDSDGRPTGALPAVSGTLAAVGVATSLVQPLLERAGVAGLDLPTDVGPIATIELTATAAAAAPGAVPATDLDLTLRSRGIAGDASLALSDRALRTRGDGVRVRIVTAGAMAARLASIEGIAVAPRGTVTLTASDVSIALDDARKPNLAASRAKASVALEGFAITPTGATPPTPLQLAELAVGATLAPGEAPIVEIQRGRLTHGQSPIGVAGRLTLAGLIGASGDITPSAARPTGRIAITGVPGALAGLASPPPGAGPPLDLAALVREAVGETIDVELVSAAAADGALDIALRATAGREVASIKARWSPAALALEKSTVRARVTPRLADSLLASLAPDLAPRPTLADGGELTLTIDPVSVPLEGTTPNLARAGTLAATVALDRELVVRGVSMAEADASGAVTRRDVGPLAIGPLSVTARVPAAALAPDGRGRAEFALSASLLGGQGRAPATITGSGGVMLSAGRPEGRLAARGSVGALDATRLDSILGRPGFVSGAAGDTLNIATELDLDLAAATPSGSATLVLNSNRFATEKPLRAALEPGALVVREPFSGSWIPSAAWVNSMLGPDGPSAARLTEAPRVTLTIDRLRLPLGAAEGSSGSAPAEALAVDAAVRAPRFAMTVGGVPATIADLNLHARTTERPGVIAVDASAGNLGAGPGRGGTPALTVKGHIAQVVDARGMPIAGAPPRATLDIAADPISTPIVDALARQDGLLVDLLGATLALAVQTRDLSPEAGSLTARAVSPRAEAVVAGSIQDGAFVQTGDVRATITEVTPGLGRRLSSALPVAGEIEKRPEDPPAVINASSLRLPISGGPEGLAGRVSIDPGTARFQASRVFGTLLKLTGQRDAGRVGRRLDPLVLTIERGVIRYDRYRLPLGEFTIETEGRAIDLVQKRVDVVTWIPLGALTDEAAGVFNTGLGAAIGQAVPALEATTMVPFRTQGPMASPSTNAAPALFVDRFGQTLLRPDRLLRDLIKGGGG